jgi:hypothetical protein
MEVPESRRRTIVDLAQVHGSATEAYDHQLDHWFSADHVRRMYESNPVWAALERRLYGDAGP